MFMHMPRRMGIVVLVVVAVCLGTYYVLVLRPPDLGNWRVYQGHGDLVRENDSTHVDIRYMVRHPEEPLFAYRRLSPPAKVEPDTAVELRYRSEWPAVLMMRVREEDDSAYQASFLLKPSARWTAVHLRAGDFVLQPAPGNTDENARLDFNQLRRRVEFFGASGTVLPTIAFVNRVELARPQFVKAPATDPLEDVPDDIKGEP